MPIIYLSPSTQEWNPYVDGGTEEYYMNLVADALEPYLLASGIRWVRNTPEMTAASSIRQSNQGQYALHLALHSNAAPELESGLRQGAEVYYSPGSQQGLWAAQLIAQELQEIYPYPWLVRVLPTTSLGEVSKTKAPAVLVEFAYHDNPEDAAWIRANISQMAEAVARAVTRYFGLPFVQPQPPRQGLVQVQGGALNIRQKPDRSSPVVARAQNHTPITVNGQWQGWDTVNYRGKVGFADGRYIRLPEE